MAMDTTTECAKFHTKRGENIRLLQDNKIAERKKFFKADGAVVFTADPIPRGKVFKVYFVEKATVDGTPVSNPHAVILYLDTRDEYRLTISNTRRSKQAVCQYHQLGMQP